MLIAGAVVVAHNTTTILTCHGRMSFLAWYMNASLVPPGPLDPITGDLISILVIDGNNTCGTLDLKLAPYLPSDLQFKVCGYLHES